MSSLSDGPQEQKGFFFCHSSRWAALPKLNFFSPSSGWKKEKSQYTETAPLPAVSFILERSGVSPGSSVAKQISWSPVDACVCQLEVPEDYRSNGVLMDVGASSDSCCFVLFLTKPESCLLFWFVFSLSVSSPREREKKICLSHNGSAALVPKPPETLQKASRNHAEMFSAGFFFFFTEGFLLLHLCVDFFWSGWKEGQGQIPVAPWNRDGTPP